MLKVATNKGDIVCKTPQEVENIIINSSKKPLDEIWVSGEDEYPCLAVLVNGDLTSICYFLNENGDMWQSVGNAESNGSVEFLVGGELDERPEYTVVSLEAALECVKQFCDTFYKPDCIEWEEL